MRAGLTPLQLADELIKLGITVDDPAQWDHGKCEDITLRHLVAIAQVTGSRFEWLLPRSIDQVCCETSQKRS